MERWEPRPAIASEQTRFRLGLDRVVPGSLLHRADILRGTFCHRRPFAVCAFTTGSQALRRGDRNILAAGADYEEAALVIVLCGRRIVPCGVAVRRDPGFVFSADERGSAIPPLPGSWLSRRLLRRGNRSLPGAAANKRARAVSRNCLLRSTRSPHRNTIPASAEKSMEAKSFARNLG